MNFLELGKEIVNEASKTWGNLFYLNSNIIQEESLKNIGIKLYNNKKIFNDYLYYKYEWTEKYAPKGNESLWMPEWWYDERGHKYQKDTFGYLVDLIIDEIKWKYDEENDIFAPRGCHFSVDLNNLVYDSNPKKIVSI